MDICGYPCPDIVQCSYPMISQTAEYALRAMVVLLAGEQGSPGTAPRFCSGQEVAARARVPVDYMSKILNSLVKSGLVSAQRGRNGGCKATRPASEISVLDVIQAVDPIRRIHTCPLGIQSHGRQLCALHRKLDDAMRTVEDAFRSATLADLLSDGSPSKPLCESGRLTQVANAIQ